MIYVVAYIMYYESKYYSLTAHLWNQPPFVRVERGMQNGNGFPWRAPNYPFPVVTAHDRVRNVTVKHSSTPQKTFPKRGRSSWQKLSRFVACHVPSAGAYMHWADSKGKLILRN